MKVSPCNAVLEKEPQKYTYEELKSSAPEGVYTDGGSLRWLVVTGTGTLRCLLLYSSTSGTLRVSEGASGQFTRTDETVCFELKKA